MPNLSPIYLGSFLALSFCLETTYANEPSLSATTPPISATQAKTKATSQQNHTATQMIYFDPVTGEVTSTPPDDFEPSSLQSASDTIEEQPLEEVEHADGSVSVHLQGRFQTPVVATIDKSSKMVVKHDKSILHSVPTIPSIIKP